ncbi:MAG: hypothetical protein AAGM67_20975, partial [Bacteroidota bacterium]
MLVVQAILLYIAVESMDITYVAQEVPRQNAVLMVVTDSHRVAPEPEPQPIVPLALDLHSMKDAQSTHDLSKTQVRGREIKNLSKPKETFDNAKKEGKDNTQGQSFVGKQAHKQLLQKVEAPFNTGGKGLYKADPVKFSTPTSTGPNNRSGQAASSPQVSLAPS